MQQEESKQEEKDWLDQLIKKELGSSPSSFSSDLPIPSPPIDLSHFTSLLSSIEQECAKPQPDFDQAKLWCQQAEQHLINGDAQNGQRYVCSFLRQLHSDLLTRGYLLIYERQTKLSMEKKHWVEAVEYAKAGIRLMETWCADPAHGLALSQLYPSAQRFYHLLAACFGAMGNSQEREKYEKMEKEGCEVTVLASSSSSSNPHPSSFLPIPAPLPSSSLAPSTSTAAQQPSSRGGVDKGRQQQGGAQTESSGCIKPDLPPLLYSPPPYSSDISVGVHRFLPGTRQRYLSAFR